MESGTRLGPYEIVELIGAGGMGQVYRARDTRLGRDVAVKILPPEYARATELRARFHREARTISALSDPHICALFDIGESEDGDGEKISYIVMEYLEGESLAGRIARGPLPVEQCLRYGAEIASALSNAHVHGIIHRDLKPGNVMITPVGVKLLDFGLAKVVGPTPGGSHDQVPTPPGGSRADTVRRDPITKSGTIVGTLQYMAPEQVEGFDADARTDIFALGVVLYEMATGKRAFSGESPVSLASSILRDEPAPISTTIPLAPRAFDRLVRRCLAKGRDDRWQSAKDVAVELTELHDELSSGRTGGELVLGGEGRRRISRAVLGITIAILVVAACGVAWISWRSRAPRLAPVPRVEVAQVTSRPGVEWFPSISPDGKWVIYAGIADGHSHIYLQSVGGRKAVDLTEDSPGDDDQPAFSPDGEQIAFRSSREGGGIFVMGRTGEAVRRLTHSGYKPTWSPDGTQIAYTTESVDLNPQNVAGRSELWAVPVAGGEPRLVYKGDAVLASWSPDGQRIAFTGRIGNPFQADIWTIPAEGGTPEQVTKDSWTDWNPVWSPDGSYIYFPSDRGGSMNLWRVAIDQGSGSAVTEPEPVVVPAPAFAHPSFSADGSRIAFTSSSVTANIQRLDLDLSTERVRGDPTWVTSGSRRWSSPDPSPDGDLVAFYSLTQPEGHVYVAAPDGSGLRQLTGDDAIDRVPRWSPDGEWIAFFSTRAGPLEIWKIRTDGSDLQQVTEGGGGMIAWSPDGKRIAATRGALGKSVSVIVFDPNRPRDQEAVESLPLDRPMAERFVVNSWSPDGRKLAGSLGLPGQGILTYGLQEDAYEKLTDFGEWPVWLPDSRRILFVSEGKAFYIVDSRSKEVTEIYRVTSDVIGPPRFSSDGATYYSRRSTEADIWVATLQ